MRSNAGNSRSSVGSAPRRSRRILLVGAATLASVAAPLTSAFAATSGVGSTQLTITVGALSVGAVGSTTTLTSAAVGGTATGTLPSVVMSDTTDTGAGWNATVGVSNLTFTGSWAAQGSSPSLTTRTSGAFTDTQNGVQYVVTTGTITGGAGPFTWTSTDSDDSAGGSGATAASVASPIGTKGISINFGVQPIITGSVYTIKAGTQLATALSLSTGGSVTTIDGNTKPTLVAAGTVTGGGAGATAYSASPLKMASAAIGTGMGTYSLVPGVSVVTDNNSWAGLYTAGLQYSIVAGP
jgi:hypothetical protein